MRLAIVMLGKGLMFLAITLCLGITIVPAFLDRVYYTGVKSSHFDGVHFFNPDGDDTLSAPKGVNRSGALSSMITGEGRPAWPEHVAVHQSKPEARVEGTRMVATWVGHATVLIQTEGLNILTDPNWSETTGPFGIGPARVAAPGVRFEDLPKIDVILISHNHYDHLDFATLKRLSARDHPRIFTGLGNDALLASEGIAATGMDWTQHAAIAPNIEVISTRNHHWGGRWGVDRQRALWTAFVIKTPHGNVFFAGDTGMGDGKWPTEAAGYGHIRLALIPIGAFRFSPGQMENGSHIGPIGAVEVFEKLRAQSALAIHWGTFHLSNEGYDTPPTMLAEVMKQKGHNPARFRAAGFGQSNDIPTINASR